jgi:hypothetical protein
MTCSLLDLPSCIIDEAGILLSNLVNEPIRPLVDLLQYLLSTPPAIELFGSLWSLSVYLVSTFYSLFVIFAGLLFVISAPKPEARVQAKEWLENVILMIIAVQSSYLIYSFAIQIISGISAGMLQLLPPNLFLLTIDNSYSLGYDLAAMGSYGALLLLTNLVLGGSYLISSAGVALLPIGLFLYFIPPTKGLGRGIISALAAVTTIPALTSFCLLAASELIKHSGLRGFKIFILTSALATANIGILLLGILAASWAILGLLKTDIGKSILLLKGFFILGAGKKQ